MKGKISDIKRFAVHDGDGIRTTVFLKGCSLKCVWCHNPEGIAFHPQLAYYENKCIHCGECVSVCPNGAHMIKNDMHVYERKKCIGCGACVLKCLGEALTFYGREATVEELLPLLMEDKDFYETSGGGVTVSGGECLCQADFCAELLKAVKEQGIHTAVVLIPIGMYKATVDNDIHFNQLEKESKARIKYKKYCSHCGKEVTSSDIVKGYEYEKNKYVVMTDDELEKIKTKKDKTIHILQFAKMSEVNMIYYEKDYYAVPDAGAEKAYELLRQALLAQKKVAIAKTVMGTNEKLLVLYPTKDGIIVKTLFYYDEIASMPKNVGKIELDKNELDMAKMLIENMTKPFEAEAYQDEYQARLREAIMKKIQGQEIVAVDEGISANVIDLMEALQKSLELSKNKDEESQKKLTGTA